MKNNNRQKFYLSQERNESRDRIEKVKRKLVPGRTYHLLRVISIREGGNGQPFIQKAVLEKLYQNFALFVLPSGQYVCYKYTELANMLQ